MGWVGWGLDVAIIGRHQSPCHSPKPLWNVSLEGTWDNAVQNGGSDGATMRFEPESKHGGNAGLQVCRLVAAVSFSWGIDLSMSRPSRLSRRGVSLGFHFP